jgi:membrane protein implicated in regulation of membrane protease activity
MDKWKLRTGFLLMAIGAAALWSSFLIPASEPWIWTSMGIAILTLGINLVILWKVVLRQRDTNWKDRKPPAQGDN